MKVSGFFRRLVCALLVCLLLIPGAFADVPDISNLTDDDELSNCWGRSMKNLSDGALRNPQSCLMVSIRVARIYLPVRILSPAKQMRTTTVLFGYQQLLTILITNILQSCMSM